MLFETQAPTLEHVWDWQSALSPGTASPKINKNNS